ncbi:TraR/DksA C4-type zinc finger protein [Nocardioides sp. CFH 31398]|uniref:TraR/DksA family transcriptional regulator n=1 Tax=Nocardioides sp. CFH 31398 TaxID=2919579 RepID=UPI001F05E5B4|nr:TraR/DksA C4-type zinc finger protein [Nocardioides sp. CFH 31398]MCH1866381.1 TraR/DksA family transcriptional regulator [Nocardioides sp. CFH 31398]
MHEGARDLLLADRELTLVRLRTLTDEHDAVVAASRDTNADDEHDPEGATIAFERSQVSSLARRARAHLAEVDAALDRLASGSYGVCEVCGAAIPEGRLEVRPTSRTCVGCASR